jgi:hypothetical protein
MFKRIAAVALAALILAPVAAYAAGGFVLKEKDDGSICFESTGVPVYEAWCLAGNGDVTINARPDNGDRADITELTGRAKIRSWSTAVSVNGTTNTIGGLIYTDETPAGEWVGTTNVTDSTATDHFRIGAAALKLAVVDAAVAGNGADNTLAAGDQDWTADENFGTWMYCDTPQATGDWVLEITDSSAGATTVNFPAIAANTWTWVKIDVSGVADASKNVVQSLAYDLSTAGAARGAMNCWFDGGAKWDTADEEAMGIDVQEGGVLGAFSIADAAATANRVTVLVEDTDYMIDYRSGNDSLIAILDESAAALFGIANVK